MSATPRNAAKIAIASDNFICHSPTKRNPGELFGKDVFSMKVMRERLPKSVFERLEKAAATGESLKEGDADVVASAMKDWAVENGATHYTHWFQPMTGTTAEKHDAFLTPTRQGVMINEFSGKMLIKGEPDASSFPSGGIRSTFEARGYTAWDPTSPAFLLNNACGKTLYIPTVFFSYTGECLDRKTPLLRSISTLSKQALRILKLFGNDKATNVVSMVGAEQEYFLVDRRYFKLRPDLMLSGRTVYGASPSKGQELEDHYFGSISRRVLAFMADVEERLLTLGIPAHTRHNEVAPGQFELAPVYESTNLATDHNMLTMEILQTTAEEHSFACLLHEKPFAGVNGSGKHNNWSMCDSDGNNLLDPGKTPIDNAQFLVFLAAVMRAVHQHSIALRLGTIGAGNDHRLGANEAPPAIISIFLGDQLTRLVESIANGKADGSGWQGGNMEIGVTTMPSLPKDISDRNRTSPFAFTGNKFEFRAVGSSQSISPANFAINAAVTYTLDEIATELETAVSEGTPLTKAVQTVLTRLFKEHLPIVFNGNGYSDEWQKEAEKRGLPNLKDTVDVLSAFSDKPVMDMFTGHGILTERELLARQEILLESYAKEIQVEAKLVSSMGRSIILPIALEWLRTSADVLASVKAVVKDTATMPEEKYFNTIRTHVHGLMTGLDELDEKYVAAEKVEDTKQHATIIRDSLLPIMKECRLHADSLEEMIDDIRWPLPKYNEMLWQH